MPTRPGGVSCSGQVVSARPYALPRSGSRRGLMNRQRAAPSSAPSARSGGAGHDRRRSPSGRPTRRAARSLRSPAPPTNAARRGSPYRESTRRSRRRLRRTGSPMAGIVNGPGARSDRGRGRLGTANEPGRGTVSDELVLVTGGSGFIGAHCILRLLEAGYRVRTTVRSLDREADVRAMLKTGGAEPGDALSFVDRRPHRRRWLAGGGRRLPLRAARRLAVPPTPAEERIRADRPRAPGRAAGTARRARRRRGARRADVVVCRHRLRPQADDAALHRGDLDRARTARPAPT